MIKDRIVFDAKLSDTKVLLIPTETIVGTPYNPRNRTQEGVRLKRLTDSVRRYGVLQPLLITRDRDLVDGNRRLAAAKLAGLSLIECIVLPAGVDKDRVFCDVNTTAEKIGGKGWLEACRHGYKTPPARERGLYDELLRLIGTHGIDMLISRKLGLNILPQCKDVRSLGLPLPLADLILKVADRKLTNRINSIRRSEIPAENKVQQIMGLLAV